MTLQAKLVAGAAIGIIVLNMLIKDRPGWLQAAFGILAFLTVVGLAAFLIVRGTGWRALAARYPERAPYTGELCRCRTFQMMALDVEGSFGTRFIGGIVRAGATSDALYLFAPSLLRSLLPPIQLPWSAVASAKPFEAPGWVTPVQKAGIGLRFTYDPGYTGEFVELETVEPRTSIRMPMYAIGDARRYLPLS